ncbi:hypothetical protein FO521_31090 [Bacillus pseudomycoides]|nr:hypothetical protein [Bacillus pseudomycoides]
MLHLDSLMDLKNDDMAVGVMGGYGDWYLNGVRGILGVLNAINTCVTREDLASLLGAFVDKIEAKQQTSHVG